MVLPSVKRLFFHSNQFHVWVSMIGFNFVFHACPQMINDVDCKLFGVCDFGCAEIKDECSLDFSNCIKNEGKHAVCFS